MQIGLILAAAIVVPSPPPGGVLPGERVAYDTMLAAKARATDESFSGATCDSAKVEVVSITPWKVTDQPQLIVWRERVRVTGCGRSSIQNLNVGRMDGAPPWWMTNGVPGDSLAEMKLQETALPFAVAQAKAGLPADCAGQALNDVYVAARPGNVDLTPPGAAPAEHRVGHLSMALPEDAGPTQDMLDLTNAWMEVWPFKVCGLDRTLGVVFIPFKDRTSATYLFLPVWQQIEAHGPGARPAPAPADR